MKGLINLYKPPGISSHTAVLHIRKILGQKKIGHSGTLDPGASGVLVLGVNQGTRVLEFLLAADKQYRAEITFGIKTDSGDSYGKVVEKSSVRVKPQDLEVVLKQFLGESKQLPPMTSAIKVHGKKLYELARKGQTIERPERQIKIHKIELVSFYHTSFGPKAVVDVKCSKGTYIRTLCEDIAEKLGTIAYMSFLVRTHLGNYSIFSAYSIDEIQNLFYRSKNNYLLPIKCICDGNRFLKYVVEEKDVKKVINGVSIPVKDYYTGQEIALFSPDGELLALGLKIEEQIKVKKVLV
ncbi:MAG: tRNA pseudouridine(55) synthase TruB [Bacillota bacterium]